jgi:hypothetical protein
MAHLYRVTVARTLPQDPAAALQGPMAAQSDPKTDFIQAVRAAFQNYRVEKQIGG